MSAHSVNLSLTELLAIVFAHMYSSLWWSCVPGEMQIIRLSRPVTVIYASRDAIVDEASQVLLSAHCNKLDVEQSNYVVSRAG